MIMVKTNSFPLYVDVDGCDTHCTNVMRITINIIDDNGILEIKEPVAIGSNSDIVDIALEKIKSKLIRCNLDPGIIVDTIRNQISSINKDRHKNNNNYSKLKMVSYIDDDDISLVNDCGCYS